MKYSVQSYLSAMSPPVNAKIGAFATGSVFKDLVAGPFPGSPAVTATMLSFQGDDADKKCADFVDMLLE